MTLEINYTNITILLSAFGGIYWIWKWVNGVNKDISFLGKRMDDFVKRMDEGMHDIRSDIKLLFRRLPPSPVEDNSPLQLNDLGDEISESLKAKDWASKTALLVADKVKGKKPFQINEFCVEYVNNEFKPDDEHDDKIRAEAYNHGLTSDQVLQVLVVVLRNQLLEYDYSITPK